MEVVRAEFGQFLGSEVSRTRPIGLGVVSATESHFLELDWSTILLWMFFEPSCHSVSTAFTDNFILAVLA